MGVGDDDDGNWGQTFAPLMQRPAPTTPPPALPVAAALLLLLHHWQQPGSSAASHCASKPYLEQFTNPGPQHGGPGGGAGGGGTGKPNDRLQPRRQPATVSAPQHSSSHTADGHALVQRLLGGRCPFGLTAPQCWQLSMERLPMVKEQFSGGTGPGRSAEWHVSLHPLADVDSAAIAQPMAQDGWPHSLIKPVQQ